MMATWILGRGDLCIWLASHSGYSFFCFLFFVFCFLFIAFFIPLISVLMFYWLGNGWPNAIHALFSPLVGL